MNQITVTFTDAQMKALEYSVLSPQEWLENVAHEMCRHAMEEIYLLEIKRMTDDPSITSIPADMEAVVLAAGVPTAAERKATDTQVIYQT